MIYLQYDLLHQKIKYSNKSRDFSLFLDQKISSTIISFAVVIEFSFIGSDSLVRDYPELGSNEADTRRSQ